MRYRLYYGWKAFNRSAILLFLPPKERYDQTEYEADSDSDAQTKADEIINELNKKPINKIIEVEKVAIIRINQLEKKECVWITV